MFDTRNSCTGYISSSQRQYSNQVIVQDIWTIRQHHPNSQLQNNTRDFIGRLHLTRTHFAKNQPLVNTFFFLSCSTHPSLSLFYLSIPTTTTALAIATPTRKVDGLLWLLWAAVTRQPFYTLVDSFCAFRLIWQIVHNSSWRKQKNPGFLSLE